MNNNVGSPPNTGTITSRPKPARANTSTSSLGMHPRAPSPSNENGNDGRPPTKRARKAINCEPCRNSKLKCDRNRPCSSCVLRGTSAQCYQDGRGHDSPDQMVRGEEQYVRVDPAQEISRLRHSINLLESHIFPNQRPNSVPNGHRRDSNAVMPKKEPTDPDAPKTAPGMLGSEGQGGLYAGATSAATHLLLNEGAESDESDSRQISPNQDISITHEYDRDLLALLPALPIIDGLVKHYFEYSNWLYRHINKAAFSKNWELYKTGQSADRILLATVCTMMAIAVHYLPSGHYLLESLTGQHDVLGQTYYEVSRSALDRRMADTKKYTLDLVELMLARTHYLTLHKTDTEEIWHVTGEVMNMGKAMGLHRDPGKWRMQSSTAERRRWAWWHIILLERWQAFMFGRPIAIASHHFDTQLPSDCDPAIDETRRLYLPNIALFKLARILGDIMDDAVSVHAVPYESVQRNDRELVQWMESLPEELDLDEYRLARNLGSQNITLRRQGAQSVLIRTAYYHIRFTLHRPYASIGIPMPTVKNGRHVEPRVPKSAASLEIAVSAADKLITMVDQSRPGILANPELAVPGHMSWGPFHSFSAAMFFSFQLIANPDQPGAGLFRANIQKAVKTLEEARGTSVADKGYDILHALSPLYSSDFPQDSSEVRDRTKSQVLSTVRKLAFPYHDSHDPRRFHDSPGDRVTIRSQSTSQSPPLSAMSTGSYDALQAISSVSSMRTQTQLPAIYTSMPQSPEDLTQDPVSSTSSFAPQHLYSQQQTYSPDHRFATYNNVPTLDDAGMWGASLGIGHGEWNSFINQLQPVPSHQLPRLGPTPPTNRLGG